MHRVTLVFILFLLIPDLYIYLVYVVRKTRKAVLHCLYWLPTLLLAAGYVYFIFLTGDNAMSNHTQAIGRLAITIMLFVFPKPYSCFARWWEYWRTSSSVVVPAARSPL